MQRDILLPECDRQHRAAQRGRAQGGTVSALYRASAYGSLGAGCGLLSRRGRSGAGVTASDAQPLESGAEYRADPRQREGFRQSGRASGGGQPVGKAYRTAGYMGICDASVRADPGWQRHRAGILRHGDQRPLFQPFPRYRVQRLWQYADPSTATRSICRGLCWALPMARA